MAAWALTMGLLYVLTVFVVQPIVLRRRTGHSGWLASFGATRPVLGRITPAAVDHRPG